MMTTCEGKYRDGVVLLNERPDGATEGPVLVTFLSSNDHFQESGRGAGSLEQAVGKIQKLFKNIPAERMLSDELIAERRDEARNE